MLIIAPTLVAAALSITFKHMVIYYGSQARILKPRLCPWIFLGTDVVSIAIQVVGAAMSSSDDPSTMNMATTILTLGVAFQAANMVFCGSLMFLYWFRLRKTRGGTQAQQLRTQDASSTREDQRLKIYIYGMIVSYVLIIIRCVYRIPEMAGGWGGDLMQDKTTSLTTSTTSMASESSNAFEDAVKGASGFIHVAHDMTSSGDPKIAIPHSVDMALSALKTSSSAGLKRFVYTSSSFAVTQPKPSVKFTVDESTFNEDAIRAVKEKGKAAGGAVVYSASKVEVERALKKWEESKAEIVINCVNPNGNLGPVLPSSHQGMSRQTQGK